MLQGRLRLLHGGSHGVKLQQHGRRARRVVLTKDLQSPPHAAEALLKLGLGLRVARVRLGRIATISACNFVSSASSDSKSFTSSFSFADFAEAWSIFAESFAVSSSSSPFSASGFATCSSQKAFPLPPCPLPLAACDQVLDQALDLRGDVLAAGVPVPQDRVHVRSKLCQRGGVLPPSETLHQHQNLRASKDRLRRMPSPSESRAKE